MSDPFLAEIRMFPFNLVPQGWAPCNGQLIPIPQNTALFSLIGTVYGGDGRSNFGLPNLNDRSPLHAGQGAGLTDRWLGDMGGSSTASLSMNQMPQHSHVMCASTAVATQSTPGLSTVPGTVAAGQLAHIYSSSTGSREKMLSTAAANAGGAEHNNRQPYLGLLFCIALQGEFPQRP